MRKSISIKKFYVLAILLLESTLCVFADEYFKCRKETYVYDYPNGGIFSDGTSSDEFYFINNFMIYPHDFMKRKYLLFYKSEETDFYVNFGIFPAYLGNGHFSEIVYGVGDPPRAKDKHFEEIKYSKTDFYKILADEFYRCYLQKELFNSDFDCLEYFIDILKIFSKEDLRILRNTIYAKYGFSFKSKDLKGIFSKLDWYAPKENQENFEDNFSRLDSSLLEVIKLAEK